MAKMKHMKQPENSPWPSRQPRPPRTPIGRDRAFRAALAKEYGVTEVPRSLQRRTAKTLERLPEALPVRPRPVLRAIRSLASVAAVLAISFAALMGLNTTHPQLTEALPGLGSVFAAMNGNDIPEPTPSPTPTPQPEFVPVTMLNNGDFPGILIINNAWSDGYTLTLDMSISPGEEFYENLGLYSGDSSMILSPATVHRDENNDIYVDYSGALSVGSGSDNKDFNGEFGGDFVSFTQDGSGTFSAVWQLDLDGLPISSELSVYLSLPDMLIHCGGEDYITYYSGFDGKFSVPVTTNKNRSLGVQVSDGPVTLKSVYYAPSRVDLDVSVPYLGLIGDLDDSLDYWNNPLGIYAQLTCMDGSYEYEFDYIGPDDLDTNELVPDGSTQLDLHYRFKAPAGSKTHPQNLKGPLVLTIYELPQYSGPAGRVLAEFTIDLSTGRAYPSEEYEKDGYEKVDPVLTTIQSLEESMYDGVLLLPNNNPIDGIDGNFGPYATFTVSAPSDMQGRDFYADLYMDGNQIFGFYFVLGIDYYEDNDGSYASSYSVLPSTGEEYVHTTVTIPYPDDLILEDGTYLKCDQVILREAVTGATIIPDMAAAVEETAERLLCRIPSDTASMSSGAVPMDVTETDG